ncbi:MAG TPA: Xaa-Pro peptidase family protein [Phycisphaerae bacterium]|nr:Xaa-Pro peptidase family protein [Phycisphaerae bacterium]
MKHPFSERRRRLARLIRKRGLGSLLVTREADVGYLSGFTGEDSWLLVGEGRAVLITDGRFAEQARREVRGVRVVVRRGPLADALGQAVRRQRGKRLGFDPEEVSVALRGRLAKAVGWVRLARARGLVAEMRLRKDAAEQQAIRRAVRVAEEAWREFRKRVRPGMTERRLAAELDHQMRLAGADGPAFPTICAAGPSSAMPHAVPGNRRLRRGMVLLVDFGARVGGYVCDLTRVLLAGRIASRVRGVYEAVLSAQGAAIARLGPGVPPADVDAAARRVLEAAGFGKAFAHGTGHGIGREVHEGPGLGPRRSGGTLQVGMVVTIEPGVYFPGRFGIRIEDDCVVTETGRRVLSHLEKDLEAMVL